MTKDDQKSSARAKPRAKPLDQDVPDDHDDHNDHDNPDDQDVPDDHDDHNDHDNPDDQDVPDDHDDHDDHDNPDGHTDRNDHDDSRDESLDKEPGSNTPYSPYSHPTHQHIPITQCTNTTILEYIRITHISIAVIPSGSACTGLLPSPKKQLANTGGQKFAENKEPESKRIHHCQIATIWKAPNFCIYD
ncbi:hypothetical protein CAPTEDRAFT_189635 [Capitella teleta]|uniref:Uncharacterized protein n=1 Tax=Capitella teleta TaxID=283909 RepID=R7T9G4_CAPTE|nr:hypothetical protein CAPTEDRAFT_189635 [Capitella teleta]|eukprot:ELT90373.1 hypothetical protein CAPTEDRAFT_189635 [Capitella teleta]